MAFVRYHYYGRFQCRWHAGVVSPPNEEKPEEQGGRFKKQPIQKDAFQKRGHDTRKEVYVRVYNNRKGPLTDLSKQRGRLSDGLDLPECDGCANFPLLHCVY